jgi:hypothetical protein
MQKSNEWLCSCGRIIMFAPLSEYIEMQLEEAFCEEYRVMSSCDRPTVDWEDYKKSFATFIVDKFTKDETHPRHPKKSPWDE